MGWSYVSLFEGLPNQTKKSKRSTGSLIGYLSKLWPVMLLRSTSNYYDDCADNKKMKISSHPSIDSIVSCYRALETGKFWFPAQVFNRKVSWDRLRAPPIDTSPHDLHISDCLNDLRPCDHTEIQWRRNKQFPYGWWYGVVGHIEACDGNEIHCHCHESDTVVLEFNQYAPGSRWRHLDDQLERPSRRRK